MKSRISKILGIGLTAGLVFGLIGAVFAAPVAADLMQWGRVKTPTTTDMVILPESNIIDYDIGGDGDTIYAVLEVDESCGYNGIGDSEDFALVKSTDGGVTWSDITANVTGAANLPAGDFEYLVAVAVAPDDGDWLAVAGVNTDIAPFDVWVVASQDGGSNFSYTGDIIDSGVKMGKVFDLAVSIEVGGIHNIAIAGLEALAGTGGALFRLKAGTWLSAAWEDTTDATDYMGWDNGLPAGDGSEVVIAIAFSPNFDLDDTIVIIVADFDDGAYPAYFLQSGIWESGGGDWASEAGFPNAVEIKSNGDTLALWAGAPFAYLRCAGLALPVDYDGSDPGARAVFLYVNARLDPAGSNIYGGYVLRADNNSLSPVVGPPGDPLLASIDVHGDADTGKLMIGEYIRFDNDGPNPPGNFLQACCCPSVRVWHTEEIDICCVQWEGACKDPSGPYMALVMYTPDGVKEYATTSGRIDDDFFSSSNLAPDYVDENCDLDDIPMWSSDDDDTGSPGDESAFSVSRDDAVSFNQIGLIDTDIDYLSDVAVCPDCSTIYLSTINADPAPCDVDYCECDSVWRSYDGGDTWERVFFGEWSDSVSDALLLRLPCDAIDDCCDQDAVAPSGTIYLGIQDGDDLVNDAIFYSRDCGQCWNDPPSPKVDLQDFCVESENIIYVIDDDGYFTKSTQYGRRWSDAADTGVGSGHSIVCCCAEGFVVVGGDANDPVGWTDDGGDNWNLTDALPGTSGGEVHVACDPTCENIVYAALDDDTSGGIFRTDLTSGAWDTISAIAMDYTGIVVANEGTLYAAFDDLYAQPSTAAGATPCDTTFSATDIGGGAWTSGAARNLGPCETDCCGTETWDYLICGLGPNEDFDLQPSELKICGCLSIDTNSVLWAIDEDGYALDDYSDGALWSYEDCAAKIGPTLTAPTDGTVIDCEPCAGCDASSFTLKWERMCEACSYDVQIMDADGNLIVSWDDVEITGDPPTLFIDGTLDGDYYYLECGETYTWKVREANTSCECVHSPWSETWSFTVAVGAADAINLLAPTKGAMDVPIENIGFSWTGVRNATSYSFVLSPNANLAGALVSQDQSTTAFNFVGPLDYSKAYYWQIIAWQDGVRLTTSSIGVFNTMAQPVAPQPPVVVEQQPAPVINIPPAEEITPVWIYAIIGIGAALAVVVIVLIVRTRRP